MSEKKRYVVINAKCDALFTEYTARRYKLDSVDVPTIMMPCEKFVEDYPDGLNDRSIVELIKKTSDRKRFYIDTKKDGYLKAEVDDLCGCVFTPNFVEI